MRESVLRYIQKCHICGTSYMEAAGETCRCPTPFPDEEPTVKDWESTHPFNAEVMCDESDS